MQTNNPQTLLIVLGILLFVGVVLAIVLPFLKRKGVDVGAILDSTKSLLGTLNNTLDTVRPFIEGQPGLETFDKIMSAARVGVGNAEQLYIIGQLEPGKRKDAARQYIEDAAKMMGLEVTPEVKRLIDGAIEAEVLELGHLKDKLLPAKTSE